MGLSPEFTDIFSQPAASRAAITSNMQQNTFTLNYPTATFLRTQPQVHFLTLSTVTATAAATISTTTTTTATATATTTATAAAAAAAAATTTTTTTTGTML